MATSLKYELADHIYQYLCHEAQYSDLPEAAKESLTAASECIEQAYKLNGTPHYQSNNNSTPTSATKPNTEAGGQQHYMRSVDILPDELLRIFTRHKEFLSQQKDSLIYPLRNSTDDAQATSTSIDKPDIRVNTNSLQQQASNNSNDHQSNTNNPNMSPTFNQNNNVTNNATSTTAQQPSSSINPNQQAAALTAPTTSKPHNQHPISQLPMTTRKKLSHLRAQIKRQASKAARSRLEKRSSVSGVASSSSSKPGHHFGRSFDANSSKLTGDASHHHKELQNQPNSSSSTESPHAHLSSQSTSSPVTGVGNSINQDTNAGTNLSLTQLQNDSGPPGAAGGASGSKLIGQHSLSAGGHHSSNHHSIHQKNFKQKIIALLKKFRTDGSDFDSEEQYREALERELMKAAAGRGSRAIEELLEEDIDVEEESGSEAEDWDNISESSTPKPSLRPFFSSTTLDKI